MGTYTTDHSASVIQTHSWRTVNNSAAYLLPYIQPTSTILDIGCGPGSITVDFASRVPSGHVTGVEYTPEPLAEVRALAASHNLTNVDFQVADIHALPFPDNTFDIVHVHQVLQHISDPVQALREMRRVAKPLGGIVAARESASMSWYPENEGIATWLATTVRVGKAKGGNPHPGRYIHVWAEEAGFPRKSIVTSTGSWCFSSPAEREYWGGSMAGRFQSSGFTKTCLEEGLASKEELMGIVKGWREYVEEEKGWFGLLHGQMLCFK